MVSVTSRVRRVIPPIPFTGNRGTKARAVLLLTRRLRKKRGPQPAALKFCEAFVKDQVNSPLEITIGDNFITSYKLKQALRLDHLITNLNSCGVLMTDVYLNRSIQNMYLSEAAQKILSVPNAGGNSVNSEVLSFEFLNNCFNAALIKTEMEVEYFPEGGSITDYVCYMFNTKVGVSVTRAMKYKGSYTHDDANRLLTKKLNGIIQSSRNTLEDWHKQILHIWATSQQIATMLVNAYNDLDIETKSTSVVIVTVATCADDIFRNK